MLYIKTILITTLLFFASTLPVSASDGLIIKPSTYAAAETLDRLEAALKKRGFTIFTHLDHAAAAKAVGLKMPYSTVLVFGNPTNGTPNFIKNPKLAIDLPLKAHVWEDAEGKVWLSYNSSQYLTTIYERHGSERNPKVVTRLENALASIANAVVK